MREPEQNDLEQVLRERLAELTKPLAKLATPPERGASLGFGKRIGDGTTEAIARITEVGVGSSLEQKADRVARALAKLDEGTYGTSTAAVTRSRRRASTPPPTRSSASSARRGRSAKRGAEGNQLQPGIATFARRKTRQ